MSTLDQVYSIGPKRQRRWFRRARTYQHLPDFREAANGAAALVCCMLEQSAAVLAAMAQYGLTDRELEYIRLVLRPNEPSVHEIAEHMDCSANTVESHRRKAYAKLGVHSRLELYYKAVHLGLVPCACATLGLPRPGPGPGAHPVH